MRTRIFLNEKGLTFWDYVFGALVVAVLAWAAKQYMLHPEGARPVTHSVLEDSK